MKNLKSKLFALVVSFFALGSFLASATLLSTAAHADVTVSTEDEAVDTGGDEFDVVTEEDTSTSEESCEDVTTDSLTVSRC